MKTCARDAGRSSPEVDCMPCPMPARAGIGSTMQSGRERQRRRDERREHGLIRKRSAIVFDPAVSEHGQREQCRTAIERTRGGYVGAAFLAASGL